MLNLRKGRVHMPNIFNTARYVLGKQGRMSTWKLQKLCYYSQAWSLAWTTRSLFDEDFEAWSNGPVCRALYDIHRGKFTVTIEDFPESLEALPALDEDQIDTIDNVLRCYGDWEPYELREQTHKEEPWQMARGDLEDGELGTTIIPKDVMGEFYGRR